jgi:hypothetical protein
MSASDREAWDRFAAAFAQGFSANVANGVTHEALARDVAFSTDALLAERAKRFPADDGETDAR